MVLESLIPFSCEHWLITLLLLLVLYMARNHFHHGLQGYPGPFLASLTDWWRFFDVLGRRPEITHIKLHNQYGDIVRLGPNVLSFADPKALKTIYGLNKGFRKVGRKLIARWYAHPHISQGFTLCSKHYHRVLDCPLCSRQRTRSIMQPCEDP
jgi:hypothetical protein